MLKKQTGASKINFIGVILLLASSVISCSPDNNHNLLNIGTNIWPGYEPLYLARHLGYFKDKNINLVEYSSSSQVIRAFRNGIIDAAALTLDETIQLLSQGYHPRIVLVMDMSDGADAIIGQADVKKITDLHHQKVGVESSALGAYFLARALEMNSMKASDFNIVALEIDEHQRAFKDKKVDAVVTFEPVKSHLLAAGGNDLFNSRQIPGEIVDVLIIRDEYARKNLAQINDVLTAWYQALEYFNKQQDRAAKQMSKRLRLSPPAVVETYKGLKFPSPEENEQYLGYQGKASLLATSARLVKVMHKQGLIGEVVDTNVLFDITESSGKP